MLIIEHLRLNLPGGFDLRARRIARLVADELTRIPIQKSTRLERLCVPPVEVNSAFSDDRIARRVAAAIQAQRVDKEG